MMYLWCFMMLYDVFMMLYDVFMMLYDHFMILYDVLWCFMMYLWCYMIHLWCYMMFYDVIWCIYDPFVMLYDVFMMLYDVLWCYMIHLWCYMMYFWCIYDVIWCIYDVIWSIYDVIWCVSMIYYHKITLYMFIVLIVVRAGRRGSSHFVMYVSTNQNISRQKSYCNGPIRFVPAKNHIFIDQSDSFPPKIMFYVDISPGYKELHACVLSCQIWWKANQINLRIKNDSWSKWMRSEWKSLLFCDIKLILW